MSNPFANKDVRTAYDNRMEQLATTAEYVEPSVARRQFYFAESRPQPEGAINRRGFGRGYNRQSFKQEEQIQQRIWSGVLTSSRTPALRSSITYTLTPVQEPAKTLLDPSFDYMHIPFTEEENMAFTARKSFLEMEYSVLKRTVDRAWADCIAQDARDAGKPDFSQFTIRASSETYRAQHAERMLVEEALEKRLLESGIEVTHEDVVGLQYLSPFAAIMEAATAKKKGMARTPSVNLIYLVDSNDSNRKALPSALKSSNEPTLSGFESGHLVEHILEQASR